MKPEVSVLMSVYKEDLKIFEKSVNSVLNQSFKNFEFIIINDSGNKEYSKLIGRIGDDRIKYLINEQNLGLTKSLIKGAKTAQGKYIARLDADDCAKEDRLKLQYEFLENNPDHVICGSYYQEIENSKISKPRVGLFQNDEEIRRVLPSFNPFAHSTLFFKRKAYEEIGGYDASFVCAQDYDFIERILNKGKGHILKPKLVTRNIDEQNISSRRYKLQLWNSLKVRWRLMKRGYFELASIGFLFKSLMALIIPKFLVFSIKRRLG